MTARVPHMPAGGHRQGVAGDATQPGPGLSGAHGGVAPGLGGSLIASLKEQQATLLARHRLALAEIERRRDIAGAATSATLDAWSSVGATVYLRQHVDDSGNPHGTPIADTDGEGTADHVAACGPVFIIGLLRAAEQTLKIHAPALSLACLNCQVSERLECPTCDGIWPCSQAAPFIAVLAPSVP